MSDDLDRERARRADRDDTRDEPNRHGTPRRLGRVATPTPTIGVGKFLKLNPAVIGGVEAEGGTNSGIAVDTSQTFHAELLWGTLVQNDYAVARAVDYRWVVEGYLSSNTTPQPGCPCNPMPNTINGAFTSTTIFGPPGRDPTSLGCPTTFVLTAQTRPSGFQTAGIVSNNTVWMSPAFTFNYYTFDPLTGGFTTLNTTTGAVIIYWCQPQNGHVTIQIYDSNNNYGGVNALLAQTGDPYVTHAPTCNPFLFKSNESTSTWISNSTFSA